MAKPPLYVVTPVRDKPELTLALLDCLARQTDAPDVVWLQDNGSSAESLRQVEELAPVELVVNVEHGAGLTIYELWNRGYWRAQQHAGGPFHVLVANNDVLLPPWALEIMSQALDEDETRGAAYPDFSAYWSDAPVPPPRSGPLAVQETSGVWGSGGMLGFCFMLAGHRIPWRPLVQDLAYEWWFGDNAVADSLRYHRLKQVRVLGLPIRHEHEGTARDFDLDEKKERDARRWTTRRNLDQVERLNRGARQVGRRDWRQRPPARPGPGA